MSTNPSMRFQIPVNGRSAAPKAEPVSNPPGLPLGELITANPMFAIGVAVALGVVIGCLIKRR